MSDSEHAASRPSEPVPESPPLPEAQARIDRHADTSAPRLSAQAQASSAIPDDTSEVLGSPARGSGDEAAPTSVDLRARQRPKLPVSDALGRRLGGGRMPGKADRRAPGR